MAKKKHAAQSRLEQLKQLEKDIARNPQLLHDLVTRPEKALSKLDYLDAGIQANLRRTSMLEVLAGLTGVLDDLNANCGPSSCGSGASCSSTCTVANSCSDTCRTVTCNGAATIAMPARSVDLVETLIQYSGVLSGLDQQVFRSIVRIR